MLPIILLHDGKILTGEMSWIPWKDWEFGQKKQPSRWLALLVLRAMESTRE